MSFQWSLPPPFPSLLPSSPAFFSSHFPSFAFSSLSIPLFLPNESITKFSLHVVPRIQSGCQVDLWRWHPLTLLLPPWPDRSSRRGGRGWKGNDPLFMDYLTPPVFRLGKCTSGTAARSTAAPEGDLFTCTQHILSLSTSRNTWMTQLLWDPSVTGRERSTGIWHLLSVNGATRNASDTKEEDADFQRSRPTITKEGHWGLRRLQLDNIEWASPWSQMPSTGRLSVSLSVCLSVCPSASCSIHLWKGDRSHYV